MTAKKKVGTPLSAEDWPLWKIIGMFLISHGVFAALLALHPYYHLSGLIIGIILTLIGIISFYYVSRTKSWWAIIVGLNTSFLLFFAIGVRSLINDFSRGWIWIVPLLACYILAWLIPYLNPKLSAFLWREQIAPQTRVGRGCMAILIQFFPIIIAAGPLLGMYGTRYGYGDVLNIVIGIIGILVAIGLGLAFSHQLWPKRPWAQQEEPEARET